MKERKSKGATSAVGRITIRRRKGNERLEIEMPAEEGLLQQALSTLGPDRKRERPRRKRQSGVMTFPGSVFDSLEGMIESEHLGLALRDREFRKAFQRFAKRSDHWTFIRTFLMNKVVVDLTSPPGKEVQALDRNAWKGCSKGAFAGVKGENVNAVIIRVVSAIPEDEKKFIFDQLTQQLPLVPTQLLSAPSKGRSTEIEVTLFGHEVRTREDPFM